MNFKNLRDDVAANQFDFMKAIERLAGAILHTIQMKASSGWFCLDTTIS